MADLTAAQIDQLKTSYNQFRETLSTSQQRQLDELIELVWHAVGGTSAMETAIDESFTAAQAAQVLTYVHGVLKLIK